MNLPQTKLQPTGQLHIETIDAVTGEVVDTQDHHNLIVSGGRQNVSKLLGGEVTGSPITQFGAGIDGTATTLDDNTVAAFTKAVTSVAYPEDDLQFAFSLEAAESNGVTIREFQLLTASNVVFARTTPAPIIKTNAFRVEITWTIKF